MTLGGWTHGGGEGRGERDTHMAKVSVMGDGSKQNHITVYCKAWVCSARSFATAPARHLSDSSLGAMHREELHAGLMHVETHFDKV